MSHTLWMDNYYNFQTERNKCGWYTMTKQKGSTSNAEAGKTKRRGTSVVSNRVYTEEVARQKEVSFVSSYHDSLMETSQRRGKEIRKTNRIRVGNKFMGGADLKDKKNYRPTSSKGKYLSNNSNTAFHNSLIIHYTTRN